MYKAANRRKCYYFLSKFGCIKGLPATPTCLSGPRNSRNCPDYIPIGKGMRLFDERMREYKAQEIYLEDDSEDDLDWSSFLGVD